MSGDAPQTEPGRAGRLWQGLRRTREGIFGRLTTILRDGSPPEVDWSDDLETALIQADVGPRAAVEIVDRVRDTSGTKAPSWDAVRRAAHQVLRQVLIDGRGEPPAAGVRPRVILVVGVNGGGKTTTVGKLARRFSREGKRVVLCAADTFRAGAGEQLRLWAERTGAEFFGHRSGADPSAVVHDAASAAVARGHEALLVDTAGRLHTQDPLMRELEKMVRVVGRRIEGAPHEVLLVLDATTGQNGVNQAREFLTAARVNGLVLTKVDGTARGGVVIRIVQELEIPLRYLGVGEQPDDLVDFDADEFLEVLLPSAA
jgi:fused signal recognition particle receptor